MRFGGLRIYTAQYFCVSSYSKFAHASRHLRDSTNPHTHTHTMNRLSALILIVAVALAAAHPADLSALSGITGLLGVATKSADVVQSPVNGALLGTGLTACPKTVNLDEFVGTCIPAHLNCVGIKVLDVVTNKVVKIPACGSDGKVPKATATATSAGGLATAVAT